MTPNECIRDAMQYAGVRSGKEVPRDTLVRIMKAEADLVASMFPTLTEASITTDADGQYDLSGLTYPMVVIDVFDTDANKLTRDQE